MLDFACLDARVALEVDGEAHGLGANPTHDEARDEWLTAQGYRTMRIPAREVLSDLGAVVTFILAQCQPLHQSYAGSMAQGSASPAASWTVPPILRSVPAPRTATAAKLRGPLPVPGRIDPAGGPGEEW